MIQFIKLQDIDNPYDTTTIEMTTYAETLPSILEDFRNFLQGCGFIINGDLEVVEHETE